MKTRVISISLVAAIGLMWASASEANKPKLEPLVVVVHGSNSVARLSSVDLKNIYLGRQTRWSNGDPVAAYMRPARSGAGFAFMRKILKMTPAKFRYHWQGRELSGRGRAPSTISQTAKLVSQIARNRGAIGYVTEKESRRLKAYVSAGRIKLIPLN